MKKVTLLTVVVLLVCGTGAWATNFLGNPSFEEPILATGDTVTWSHGDIVAGGWQVGHPYVTPDPPDGWTEPPIWNDDVVLENPAYAPGIVLPTEGDNYLTLAPGMVAAGIRQFLPFAFQAGMDYTLTVDVSRLTEEGTWVAINFIAFDELTSVPTTYFEYGAMAEGTVTANYAPVVVPPSGDDIVNHSFLPEGEWEIGSWGTLSLTFNTSDAPDMVGKYGVIDIGGQNVIIDNVVATPEPATMMLLGLGGLLLRKRR